ncbi:hypothetical protein ACWENQ_06085 [Nonomuraea sp. NPDC004354]
MERHVTGALLTLMHEVPVSKEVRAAAYTAFRSQPGVKDLGPAKDPLGRGGRRFDTEMEDSGRFTAEQYHIIDPTTFTLLSSALNTTVDGKPLQAKTSVTIVKSTGWTSEKPAVPAD